MEKRSQFETLKTFLPFLWCREDHIRWRVLASIIFLIFARICMVYVPILYKGLVDSLTQTVDVNTVIMLPMYLLLSYGSVRLLSVLFEQLRNHFFAFVQYTVAKVIASQVFTYLHRLSMRFHLDRQTGGLSRLIDRGVKSIEFLLHIALFDIIPTIIEMLFVCGVLWYYFGYVYAVVIFSTVVIYVVYTLTTTEWRLKFRREMNKQDDNANTKAVDSLLNYETVKYFNNEQHEHDRFEKSISRYVQAGVKSATSLAVVNIGQGVIITVSLFIVMYMAANGIVENRMSIGDFVLVNTYLMQLFIPLNFLGFFYRATRQHLTDMEKLFSTLDVPQEVVDEEGAPSLDVKVGGIEFKDVCFHYNPERPILKGVSFSVNPGETVALVGPSGAGKSTINRLLFRFYEVCKGSISIDGQDIKKVTQGSVRSQIGIVPQDTVLFNDTLHYNIAYGCPSATDKEIQKAAEMAQLSVLLERLPLGMQTMVGERGLKLSGGEKQRVAIARTILKNTPILLFDEATSALDSATEQEILKSLEDLSKGRTTLIIAHRLSTVKHADRIIVLDQGEVVESGDHDSLIANNDLYAQMWQRQQREKS